MRFAHDSSLCGGSLLGAASADAEGVSSVGLRLTAPSAEGAEGISPLRRRDFVPAGTTKGLCDRPLETFAPCGGDCWQVAAALSAAVTITMPIGDTPTLHGHPSPKETTSLFPPTRRSRRLCQPP